ncbi:large-conductance mechanosensitive channel protein MscL [Fulvivirga sediminis]|uniref:Large-conductance mechanosensitive channel n=1 Tax=Fulvivirga sediminis TaxID=2803949 RepID=A0A937F8F3_9BACT|nr:large-conductance mechanosensitive channel protein MscL [Fulvivirga sediminis]MBL3658236.1 large-conductance mechanosensitive channel protein MscL [Fulvivirga sediminis]
MFTEFKKFISRGNVVELGVGLILATYFGAIVKSFVDDIVMPPVGQLIAGIDFSELKYKIAERTLEDGSSQPVTINYGLFINTVITFFIVALAVFLLTKIYNNFLQKKKAEPAAAEAAPTSQEQLLMEIRDAIREQNRIKE